MIGSIGGLVYTVVGFFVANANGYLAVSDFNSLLSAILAVVLWPLLFLGVDLHLGGA
jgi:hypothetical protein